MSDEPQEISKADQRFIERLAEDLGRILGTGILIDELRLSPAGEWPAMIRVLCMFDGGAEVLEVAGATRLEAYNRLVKAAAEMRLAIAARRMIGPV